MTWWRAGAISITRAFLEVRIGSLRRKIDNNFIFVAGGHALEWCCSEDRGISISLLAVAKPISSCGEDKSIDGELMAAPVSRGGTRHAYAITLSTARHRQIALRYCTLYIRKSMKYPALILSRIDDDSRRCDCRHATQWRYALCRAPSLNDSERSKVSAVHDNSELMLMHVENRHLMTMSVACGVIEMSEISEFQWISLCIHLIAADIDGWFIKVKMGRSPQ